MAAMIDLSNVANPLDKIKTVVCPLLPYYLEIAAYTFQKPTVGSDSIIGRYGRKPQAANEVFYRRAA